MKNQVTVAIMGYGLCSLEYGRSIIEIYGLTNYLYSCIEYILDLHSKGLLSGVVFCGGFTNPKFPDKSEAGTTARYFEELLREHGIYKIPFPILLEEQSRNTPQNIVFTGNLMTHRSLFTGPELVKTLEINKDKAQTMLEIDRQWEDLSHNIIFVCDRYRYWKVRVMLKQAEISLPNDFILNVVSFPRQDTHRNSSWGKQLLAALAYWLNPTLFSNSLKVGKENPR